MAKKGRGWILETGCPFLEYVDITKDPGFKEIQEAFARGEDLSKYNPALARVKANLTPEQLHTMQMMKNPDCTERADKDGTINFTDDEEAKAIALFWMIWPGRKVTHFNEKYGNDTPRQVKDKLLEMKREQEDALKANQRYADDGRVLGIIR